MPHQEPRPELERRENDSIVLVLVQKISNDVNRIEQVLTNHIKEEKVEIASMVSKLLNESFPEGDADGHRRFHEASIRKAERSADFWSAMAKSVGTWGLVGFLGWVVYSLWKAFLLGPTK